jgi:MSHA biogenesis protein MshG
MAEYLYRAISSHGESSQGTVVAGSEADAVTLLAGKGLTAVDVRAKPSDQRQKSTAIRGRTRPGKKDLEFFSRELATLLRAGLPMLEALDALRSDLDVKCLAGVLKDMMGDVQGGASLAEAMHRHKEVFPDAYVEMVRAGEAGGVVPETLDQMSQMMESRRETTQEIKSALRYPMIVIGALAISFLVLVTFVLPKLSMLFTRFGTSLPLPTRLMIQFYGFLKDYWLLLAIVGGVVMSGVYFVLRMDRVRYRWDRIKMRLPVLGPIYMKVSMERFCETSRTMIQAGVPILRVLECARGTTENAFLREEIGRLKTSVHAGNQMSDYMRQSDAFPQFVTLITRLGEKTGQLPELMKLCAHHYRQDVRYRIKNLVTSIEPLLTLVIGATVFLLMLSVFMPIWNTVRFLKRT